MFLMINEIFNSISGEVDGFGGQGRPATFIRLQGCNLPIKCAYCDSLRASVAEEGYPLTLAAVLNRVTLPKVIITGGEPLRNFEGVKKLTEALVQKRAQVTIETNGTVEVPEDFIDQRPRAKYLRIVMDYKLPGSKVEGYMNLKAFELLRKYDVIKFVVSDEKDFERMKQLLARYSWKAQIAISPAVSSITKELKSMRVLVRKIIKDPELQRVQFSLQLHKLLGVR